MASLFFGLLARQNRLQCIAGLGDVSQIEDRLRLHRRLARRAAAIPAAEVIAHLCGLVGLNRTGMRLCLGDANRRQSVQNGSALHFQLSCKIVDSNFAHPSLFISPARLAVHISLIEVGICLQLNVDEILFNSIIPEIAIDDTADCVPASGLCAWPEKLATIRLRLDAFVRNLLALVHQAVHGVVL
jgi:hypothetical protein